MLPLCDREDRLAARFYEALRVDCPCCTFYRGVVVGMAFAALGMALIYWGWR